MVCPFHTLLHFHSESLHTNARSLSGQKYHSSVYNSRFVLLNVPYAIHLYLYSLVQHSTTVLSLDHLTKLVPMTVLVIKFSSELRRVLSRVMLVSISTLDICGPAFAG